MAPAASIHAATSAGPSSKRPPASHAEQQLLLPADPSSALPLPQLQEEGDDSARSKRKTNSQEQQLECPRCRSTNTKFCYYNNYSTAQPRHFCRACRRYWTHGGTLRDVPVGGATRRTKRRRIDSDEPSSFAPSPPHATTQQQDACPPDLSSIAAFPFLSDGSYYLPQQQLDLGFFVAPPPPFPWVVPDFYDGTVADGGAWGDMAGLDFTWPPPPPGN